jgi:DNA-binding MarR family transcriptional regulator
MFKELDPILHVQQRLAIMSILISVEEADFLFIQKQTGMTSGNLSMHIDKLNTAGYIEVSKSFVGKRPRTTCKITQVGLDAFENYVKALKSYIHPKKKSF